MSNMKLLEIHVRDELIFMSISHDFVWFRPGSESLLVLTVYVYFTFIFTLNFYAQRTALQSIY